MGAVNRIASDLDARIASVEKALAGARDKWSSWSVAADSFFGGGDPKEVLGALSMMQKNGVAKWEARGAAFKGTSPDQPTLDKWIADGNQLLHDLKEIAGWEAESELGTVLADTAAASATQVKNGVGGALVWWGEHGKTVLILAGIVAALVAAWRFGLFKVAAGIAAPGAA